MTAAVKCWYVLVAEVGHDLRVARDLSERGYEVYVAKTYDRIRVGRQNLAVARLRLPGFVWVKLDYGFKRADGTKQSMREIADTVGVSKLVSLCLNTDGELNPSEVPEFAIKGMKHDENADHEAAVRRVRKKESQYAKGDWVRVAPNVAFGGWEGSVDEARNGGLMILLDGRLPVRIPEKDVFLIRKAVTADDNRAAA